MRVLLGTVAYNQHVQNIARALYEHGWLGEFRSGGADVWRSRGSRAARTLAGRLFPAIESRFARRKVAHIPAEFVSTEWRWESGRLAAGRLGLRLVEDWMWEQSEHAMDRYCATSMAGPAFDLFMGVEHGALEALQSAKRHGKAGMVAFLSAHHKTRERWVNGEYERFPDLLTPSAKRLLQKGRARDGRRDEEAHAAEFIHCASRFTRDSLVAAGLASDRIIVAPLGCPTVGPGPHRAGRCQPTRFIYSGTASVAKGAHLLLDAWKMLKPGRAAELHFFGSVALPSRCLRNLGPGVVFHGPVSARRIADEYLASSALVFPTLCDGFGMVVAEALSAGLPVITTANAGAAD